MIKNKTLECTSRLFLQLAHAAKKLMKQTETCKWKKACRSYRKLISSKRLNILGTETTNCWQLVSKLAAYLIELFGVCFMCSWGAKKWKLHSKHDQAGTKFKSVTTRWFTTPEERVVFQPNSTSLLWKRDKKGVFIQCHRRQWGLRRNSWKLTH